MICDWCFDDIPKRKYELVCLICPKDITATEIWLDPDAERDHPKFCKQECLEYHEFIKHEKHKDKYILTEEGKVF